MGKDVWVPIITALIGLIGGLFPGYGPTLLDAIKNRDLPKFSGEWTGGFKEWCTKEDCPDGPKWVISLERVKIKQWGSRVTASAQTEDLKPRDWEASGRYRTPVLSMAYVDEKPAVVSVGAYVLESDTERGKFHGYWTGYDRDLNSIVTCPYVLVPGQVPRRKFQEERDLVEWLRQDCSVARK